MKQKIKHYRFVKELTTDAAYRISTVKEVAHLTKRKFMYRKIIIVAASLALCMSAMAMPKPSEVKAAISKGDFATAEVLLKQVIVEKPTSARAHSDLGAVYAREGKTDLATQEAETAKKLVADEQAAAESKKLADAKASSEFMYILFGVPLAALAIWLLYMLYAKFRDARIAQEEEFAENKQKTSTLLGFAKQLEDAALIAKTATYSDADKTQIGKFITSLQVQVRNMLADLKDGDSVSSTRISTVQSNVETAVYQAANGLAPTPVEDSANSYSGTFRSHPRHTTESRVWGTPAPVVHAEPTPTIVHHYHETAPAQVAPVIVNNSGNDMLTGMMIGEMMSSHNDRTIIVEREHDSYERPSHSSRNDDDDSYSSSSRSSSRDDDSYSSSSPSSSSSSDDSYSSSSSSSSDSYSSSDSGSSSSDSY
jgi:hypothetical protein